MSLSLSLSLSLSISLFFHVSVFIYVCVCVCVKKKKKNGNTKSFFISALGDFFFQYNSVVPRQVVIVALHLPLSSLLKGHKVHFGDNTRANKPV